MPGQKFFLNLPIAGQKFFLNLPIAGQKFFLNLPIAGQKFFLSLPIPGQTDSPRHAHAWSDLFSPEPVPCLVRLIFHKALPCLVRSFSLAFPYLVRLIHQACPCLVRLIFPEPIPCLVRLSSQSHSLARSIIYCVIRCKLTVGV